MSNNSLLVRDGGPGPSDIQVVGPHSGSAAPDRARLVGMTRPEIQCLLEGWGEPSYRAAQVARWIYARGIDSPDSMTDLPASLRSLLTERTLIDVLSLMRRQKASDGTEKLLFALRDGEAIETVTLPFTDRTSICVSSQVGCPIRCSFCATGRSGYARNLSAGEIVGQLLVARRLSGREITHVVFMGMGEPLLNLKAVLRSARLMRDEIGIPMRHITISTVGLVPEMRELADQTEQFTLAVSLHAPNDVIRRSLIPVARRYPLQAVLDASEYYLERTGRRVTYEYVLLRNVNDRTEHAGELAALLQGRQNHVNLIPYNPGAADEYHAPDRSDVVAFRKVLERAGIAVTQRMEKGQEIMAACGQLRKQNFIESTGGVREGSEAETAGPDVQIPSSAIPIPGV